MKLTIEIHNAGDRTPEEVDRIVSEVADEVGVDLSNGHEALGESHLYDAEGNLEATYSYES